MNGISDLLDFLDLPRGGFYSSGLRIDVYGG